MFTFAERSAVAERVFDIVRANDAIVAAATIGDAAAGVLDEYSDIDLRVACTDDQNPGDVQRDLTDALQAQVGAVDHTEDEDAVAHLLPNLLIVRTEVTRARDFGPRRGEPFAMVFSTAQSGSGAVVTDGADAVSASWLRALRTRAALRRGDTDTAAQELELLQQALLELMRRRTGAPQGHVLAEDLPRFRATHAASHTAASIGAAYAAAVELLDAELQSTRPALGDVVALPLLEETAS